MKRENDSELERSQKHMVSFEQELINIVRAYTSLHKGEYHWIDGGQAKLQLEVETFPVADQIVIINNMFTDLIHERSLMTRVTNELLKILYRSVRALKNRLDEEEEKMTQVEYKAHLLDEVTKSVFRFGNYSHIEVVDSLKDLYKMVESSGEIRGIIMYLQKMAVGDSLMSLPFLKEQLYTYLKFEYLRYDIQKSEWYLVTPNAIYDYISKLGYEVREAFENLEELDEELEDEELDDQPYVKMVKETDYMLKRSHEVSDYTLSCLNVFTDIVRVLKFGDVSITDFLVNEYLTTQEEDYMPFEDLVLFIRGVIIGRVVRYGVSDKRALDILYKELNQTLDGEDWDALAKIITSLAKDL
jgi:hypothetical protein